MKNITVSIGIPALNEQSNIRPLLNMLLKQIEKNFQIKSIYILSDGSTDNTVKFAKEINDKRINIITGKEKIGKPKRVNQFFKLAEEDVCIVLDADIKIASDKTILNLLLPLIKDSTIDHTSGHGLPLKAKNTAEKIANAGVEVWDLARKSLDKDNLYLCEGRIRAFRKRLYKQMLFPCASADEAFTYLYCKAHNFKYKFCPNAIVYYQLAGSLSDFLKQMKRFIKSENIQNSNFSEELVRKYYVIDTKMKFIALFKNLLKNPVWTTAYFLTIPIPRILMFLDKDHSESAWVIISSTKILEGS